MACMVMVLSSREGCGVQGVCVFAMILSLGKRYVVCKVCADFAIILSS